MKPILAVRLPTYVALLICLLSVQAFGIEENQVQIVLKSGRVVFKHKADVIATYVFKDESILRPYFCNVSNVDGVQVTRNHPPQDDDDDDHRTMHPGIWWALGDVSGQDFWRNQATIKHEGFTQEPSSNGREASFVESRTYRDSKGEVVCREKFRFQLRLMDEGLMLTFDSTFEGDDPFYFGDQEEMGLGVRVATSMTEKRGGQLLDADERLGAREIWSQAATWCDYAGSSQGQKVGVAILCHPENFRPSWFHARDYGLLVANPFGRKAMKKGDTSRIQVEPGEMLRLRYGVWIHSEADSRAIDAAYQRYVELTSHTTSQLSR